MVLPRMEHFGLSLVSIVALLGCAAGPPARELRPAASPEPSDPSREREGHHQRLTTPRGPVHVWRPAGYDPATAGILVYLHGYYVDVDTAWHEHRLVSQFTLSNRNAIFIAPEVPAADEDPVGWPRLAELLEAVSALGEIPLPTGPVVALAHSGGFRTVVPWLASGRLDSVILLDGLYGNEEQFGDWLAEAGNHARSLVLAGGATTARTERFLRPIEDALIRDAIPDRPGPNLRQADARVLFFRSQYGHMELVTEEKAIPSLLRLTRLSRLAQQG
ncbi:MAG: hypothetical protein H6Q89_1036 [Myxococcaceae bacterium]|nr:hypothetical protein [Myxococcaceae bacterium]